MIFGVVAWHFVIFFFGPGDSDESIRNHHQLTRAKGHQLRMFSECLIMETGGIG